MNRREFIAGLGGAAVWLLAARAQQRIPVIGFLFMAGPESGQPFMTAFMQALKEAGFIEGQNVALESRFAFGKLDRLPALAADLVERRVDLIYAQGLPAILAAKAATVTVPIVFGVGEDPVKEGVVASLNRPGGNATGWTAFSNQLMAKRIELLHQVAPKATVIGFLVNPNNPNADPDSKDPAALALGINLRVLAAASVGDFEQIFATISQEHIGALLVGIEPFFWGVAAELTALAAQHAVPALYDRRLFPAAGGLMSYGTTPSETPRLFATYVSRILRGAKPTDLPVTRTNEFELIINLMTAKALGLQIPPTLLAIADEVIE